MRTVIQRIDDLVGPIGVLATVAVALALAAIGCQPSGGGGGSGTTQNTVVDPPATEPQPVIRVVTPLDFGSEATFDLAPAVPQTRAVQIMEAVDAPRRVVGGEAGMNKSAVRLTKTVGVPRLTAQAAPDTLDVRIAAVAAGGSDPCSDGIEIGMFRLTLNAAGDDFTIDPPLMPLSTDLLRLLLSGSLDICIDVQANFGGNFELDGLELTFDGQEEDEVDRVAITFTSDGRDVGQISTDDPLFFAVLTEPQSESPVAGEPFYGIELGSGDICGDTSASTAIVGLVIEDAVTVTGPVVAGDFRGYLTLGATFDDFRRVGVYCNSENPDVLAGCESSLDARPTGTINLRLEAGRLTGSFDLTIFAANTTPPGGVGTALRAYGDINLPMTLVQLPPCQSAPTPP